MVTTQNTKIIFRLFISTTKDKYILKYKVYKMLNYLSNPNSQSSGFILHSFRSFREG